jgi:outer membrane lipoprotein-sorting protein
VIFAAGAAVLAPCRAQDAGDPSALLSSLRQKYGSGVELETDFDLEIFWKTREKTEKKEGTLYLAPTDRFRLELATGVWVSDGRTYWQYSSATQQVVIKNLLDVDLRMHPSQIISRYLHDYTYTMGEHDGRQAVLVWMPAEGEEKPDAKSVSIWVDTKKLVMKKLVVEDTGGNVSTYTFKKTRIGETVPQSVFTFDTPEGASVLDTRK